MPVVSPVSLQEGEENSHLIKTMASEVGRICEKGKSFKWGTLAGRPSYSVHLKKHEGLLLFCFAFVFGRKQVRKDKLDLTQVRAGSQR